MKEVVKMNYSEQLKTPEWARKRLVILKRDKFKCTNCGEKNFLCVHHIKYINGNKAWEVPDRFLTTLCELCHWKAHNGIEIKKFVKRGRQMTKAEKDKRFLSTFKMSKKDRAIQAKYDKFNKSIRDLRA